MVVCGNCGAENPQGAKFCNECGKELPRAMQKTCKRCGADNAPEMTTCGNCGAPLDTAPRTSAVVPQKILEPQSPKPASGLPKRYCRHCGAEVGIWDTECPNCHKDPSYVAPAYTPEYLDDSLSDGTVSSGTLTGALIFGAIMAILAGLLALGQGILYASVSAAVPSYVPTGSLCFCGGLDILFGLASLAAGVFALRRSNFGLALLGAVLGMLGLGLLIGALFGLIAVILIAISRNEFD